MCDFRLIIQPFLLNSIVVLKPPEASSTLLSPLSLAPMIDWTTSPFRVLMRILAPKMLLYTEMLTTGAVLNNPLRALHYHNSETPLALQLGGADEKALAGCARLAEKRGFAEINLNIGCPSNKVQAGRFGACLMADPKLVRLCVTAMKEAVAIPVTVKTRIGIDNQDSYAFFADFIHQLVAAGCDKIIVHARKAWLQGLSPKQNRTIPPLHYDFVYQVKQELPQVPITINGNISTVQEIHAHLQHVDGVMIGRLACQNPYALATIHHQLYPAYQQRSRHEIMIQYLDYLRQQFIDTVPMSFLVKPIISLAHGLANARKWKEKLQSAQQKKQLDYLIEAVAMLEKIELQ